MFVKNQLKRVSSHVHIITKTIKKAIVKNVSLTPSVKKNSNSSKIFSNFKDKRRINCRKKSSFVIRCANCNFKITVVTSGYDVERSFKFTLEKVNSDIYKHCESSNHSVDTKIEESSITRFSSEYDLLHAQYAKSYPK